MLLVHHLNRDEAGRILLHRQTLRLWLLLRKKNAADILHNLRLPDEVTKFYNRIMGTNWT
jgi:hypothetical protein